MSSKKTFDYNYYDINNLIKHDIKKYGVKNVLKNIDIEVIESFLRSKKLEKINKK